MGGLGAPELIIILLVVLLLFGSTKLPKLAKSLGEASKEFKKGIGDGETSAPAGAPVATPPQAAAVPPAAPAAPAPPLTPTAPVAPAAPAAEEKVTLTRAELDALLAAREAQARRGESEPPLPPAAESPRDVPPTA